MAVPQPTCPCGKPEIWKPVVGYEGSYEVSDHGRVRSLDRVVVCSKGTHKHLKGALMKLTTQTDRSPKRADGYRQVVNLRRPGHGLVWKVHRLVMLAFVGERPKDMEICHNDGNSLNNHLDNLRYDTSSNNNWDMIEHGTHGMARRDCCSRGHKFVGKNLIIIRWPDGRFRQRLCRACKRVQSRVTNNPDLKADFQELSDIAYRKIMGESNAKKAS